MECCAVCTHTGHHSDSTSLTSQATRPTQPIRPKGARQKEGTAVPRAPTDIRAAATTDISTPSTGAEQIAAFFARNGVPRPNKAEVEPMPDPEPVADKATQVFSGSLAFGGVQSNRDRLSYARR